MKIDASCILKNAACFHPTGVRRSDDPQLVVLELVICAFGSLNNHRLAVQNRSTDTASVRSEGYRWSSVSRVEVHVGTHPASTASQRKVGRVLRRRRELAKLTLADVAERMEWSQSKVSRIETGHTSISSRDVKHLMEMYGAPEAELDELVEKAKEARQKARQKTWWYPYSTVLVTSYVSLEEEARSIRAYSPLLVPGLLQTREYAEATVRSSRPADSDQTVMDRIDIRMRRQSLITRHDNAISFWAVLDEAVLCRPVGGEEVMRAQLRSLYEATLRRNVTIQVLPFVAGEHPAMTGVFTILGFSGSDDTPIVYAEHETGGLFLEKAEEYQRYDTVFDAIQSVALSPAESAKLLADLAEETSWKSRPTGPTRAIR